MDSPMNRGEEIAAWFYANRRGRLHAAEHGPDDIGRVWFMCGMGGSTGGDYGALILPSDATPNCKLCLRRLA